MTILDSKQRKARKGHRCNLCGENIHIGEIYNWDKIVNNGELYEWKAHLSCSNLAHELDTYDYDYDGITQESFQEGVKEEYAEMMYEYHHVEYAARMIMNTPFKEKLEYLKEVYEAR